MVRIVRRRAQVLNLADMKTAGANSMKKGRPLGSPLFAFPPVRPYDDGAAATGPSTGVTPRVQALPLPLSA